MANRKLVLAIFENEAAADAAVQPLRDWEKADYDNAIGVLVLDEEGKIKTHKLGERSVGEGAGIGLLLALVTPVGWIAGALGGGVLGALHRKGLGITAEDRERLAAELTGGKAALGVLAPEFQATEIAAKLASLGGTPEVHTVSEEAAAEADQMAPAVAEAEAAAT
jgi:uncharacterized membrane protein